MKTRILTGIVIVLLVALGYCGWRYYGDVIRPEQELAAADSEQRSMFDTIRPVPQGPAGKTPETAPDADAPEDPLLKAAEINPSVAGWITIPGTHIDHPIAQAADNDFYLHNGFDGQYNYELGCPFLDCRCAADLSGFNSIVYAHHMTKQRMFADIALFKDEVFMQAHPEGTLTLHDGVHRVVFFAYLNVPSTSQVYRTDLLTDDDKKAYLTQLLEAADHTAGVTADDLCERSDLHLLLLSTCTYEYDDARGIVAGIIE